MIGTFEGSGVGIWRIATNRWLCQCVSDEGAWDWELNRIDIYVFIFPVIFVEMGGNFIYLFIYNNHVNADGHWGWNIYIYIYTITRGSNH